MLKYELSQSRRDRWIYSHHQLLNGNATLEEQKSTENNGKVQTTACASFSAPAFFCFLANCSCGGGLASTVPWTNSPEVVSSRRGPSNISQLTAGPSDSSCVCLSVCVGRGYLFLKALRPRSEECYVAEEENLGCCSSFYR